MPLVVQLTVGAGTALNRRATSADFYEVGMERWWNGCVAVLTLIVIPAIYALVKGWRLAK